MEDMSERENNVLVEALEGYGESVTEALDTTRIRK
jgi:hypothetical protein